MINSINSLNTLSYTRPNESVSVAAKGVEISYNPQDEMVMEPIAVNVPNIRASNSTLEGENVKFAGKERITPNDEGN